MSKAIDPKQTEKPSQAISSVPTRQRSRALTTMSTIRAIRKDAVAAIGWRQRALSSCSKVHWRGALSGRQRTNLVPWRKRSPLM